MCLEFRRVLFRSEEHTSELQSHDNLVCRLLLAKKTNAGVGPGHRIPTRGRRHRDCVQRAPVCSPAHRAGAARPWAGPPASWSAGFFFFNDTATAELSPLSPPAALPI